MTIDRAKLVELLVEKTGFSKEQVEGQLTELVARIQAAAGEGKSFEIEGFGLFSMSGGALSFEPAEELRTEINNDYAGMEPIELIGANKEESTPEPADQGDEADEVEDPFAGLDMEEEEEPAPAPFNLDVDLAAEEEKSPPPEEPEMEEASATPEPDPEADFFEFEEEFAAEKGEPPRKTKWEPAPELKGLKQTPARKSEKDTIGSVLIVATVVIVLGVGGWFAYEMGLFSGILGSDTGGQAQQQTVQQTPPPVQQLPENGGTAAEQSEPGVAEPELSELEPESQAEGAVSEPSAVNEVAEEESSQPPASMATYGLMGTTNPDANDGYTIVVHSMRSRVVAESVESELANDGYRTLLMGTTVNGNQYWRIGIGQFETVNSAQAAAGNLTEPYRSENFIRRIDN